MPPGALPAARFDLVAKLDRMRGAERPAPAFAKTLFRSPSLRLLLISMEAGARIPKHRAEGAITIQVTDGRIWLHHSGATTELASGGMATIERDIPHSLDTTERSGVLLSTAWMGHHRPT